MWNVPRSFQILIVGLLLVFIPQAKAGITSMLGDQDFADGYSPIYASELAPAGAGEPFPFDGTIFGNDPGGTFGDFSYTRTFSLGGQSAFSASITIGLIDHDSISVDQDTIDIFFDGIQQDDSMWLGISQKPSSVSVRSMAIVQPAYLYSSLSVGTG